jgi:hypothetical protein
MIDTQTLLYLVLIALVWLGLGALFYILFGDDKQ